MQKIPGTLYKSQMEKQAIIKVMIKQIRVFFS